MADSETFERRKIRFLALAEKYRGLAGTTHNPEVADGFSKLADGYDTLAAGCAKLARHPYGTRTVRPIKKLGP